MYYFDFVSAFCLQGYVFVRLIFLKFFASKNRIYFFYQLPIYHDNTSKMITGLMGTDNNVLRIFSISVHSGIITKFVIKYNLIAPNLLRYFFMLTVDSCSTIIFRKENCIRVVLTILVLILQFINF